MSQLRHVRCEPVWCGRLAPSHGIANEQDPVNVRQGLELVVLVRAYDVRQLDVIECLLLPLQSDDDRVWDGGLRKVHHVFVVCRWEKKGPSAHPAFCES